MLRLRPAAVLLLALCAAPSARVWAQDQGVAVITSPLEGAIVSGLVPITGTATHAQFQRYELAFGYSPNPADTWFTIQEASTTALVNEVIGRWDTTQIADGEYALRLRVYWSEQAFLEAFVQNVRVQNGFPTATLETLPTGTAAGQTPEPLPPGSATGVTATPATQAVIALPPAATPRPTAAALATPGGRPPAGSPPLLNVALIRGAFLDGVRLTLIGFALLGAYVSLRAALRGDTRR